MDHSRQPTAAVPPRVRTCDQDIGSTLAQTLAMLRDPAMREPRVLEHTVTEGYAWPMGDGEDHG